MIKIKYKEWDFTANNWTPIKSIMKDSIEKAVDYVNINLLFSCNFNFVGYEIEE